MVRLVAKCVAALLAACAAAALGLDGAEVIALSDTATVAAIVVSTVLAAGSTMAGAAAEWRARRLGARRDQADILLSATGWAIVDQVGSIDYRDLGLAAYRLQRPWWSPWRIRLARVHRVRAKRRPVSSNIDWRPGKGVIGACVEQRQVVAFDLREVYSGLGSCTRQEWDTLVPDDIRLGLSYDEFLDVRDKYDVVVASPIIDDSGSTTEVRGCVALDGPSGSFELLTQTEVLGLLDSASEGLLHQRL